MGKKLLCALLLLPLSVVGHAEENRLLRFGVFPYVNPAKLIEHHKSFVEYLEERTGRRIQLLTSPDYKTFLQRTRDNEFDIILTAPHFGRVAELNGGYQRIAMTRHMVQGIYLAKPDADIKSLRDLKGKRITIAAPTSIIYRLAEQQLRDDYGMVNGRDVQIIPTGTHNNAMFAVIRGESEVGVTGIKLYQALLKQRGPIVKKIGETRAVPGFMLLANNQVDAQLVQSLRQAARSFSGSKRGEGFVFLGYKDIDDQTMQMLDAYTKDLK